MGGSAQQRVRSRQRGQATVELALALPFVVFAALVILQVAVLVRDQLAVEQAAREAVRSASVDPDVADARAAARRAAPGATIEVGVRPAVGEPIRVRVTYRTHTEVPLVGPLFPDLRLSATAVMRVER